MPTIGWGNIPGNFVVGPNQTVTANAGCTGFNATTVSPVPTYSQSSVSRSLNSVFVPSSSNDMYVSYSVSIATSLSLTTGSAGTVALQISANGTSGWTTISQISNAQTGTLTIGLGLNQTITGCLSGTVPAGYSVQLVTTNTTGTPTFTYACGQESTTI